MFFGNTSQWIKGDRIGRGSHGTVYLALATTGEIMAAVKKVKLLATPNGGKQPEQKNLVKALHNEWETLRGLYHENIVQYLGFEENQTTINIFLQYISGGTIGGYLRNSGRFRKDVTKSFSRQILQGLAYLHSKGILHRDMTSDNILVEETGVCKIFNFGISKRLDIVEHAFSNMKGTRHWMAPEVFGFSGDGNGYDTKVDIWSLGCIVFEMWTAKRPWFEQFSILELMINLMDTKTPPPLPEDLHLSISAEHFRQECFQFDPEKRPNADFLLTHPYLILPADWTFPGMSNMSEPPLSPAAEGSTEIARYMRFENHPRRVAFSALTMASGTHGTRTSPNSAPRVDSPRPITPPLVIIVPPPPRKPPIQDNSSVDSIIGGDIWSTTPEYSTGQKSSHHSATTRTRRVRIRDSGTIPDVRNPEKKREQPMPPGFVYSPPSSTEISAPAPYTPLPKVLASLTGRPTYRQLVRRPNPGDPLSIITNNDPPELRRRTSTDSIEILLSEDTHRSGESYESGPELTGIHLQDPTLHSNWRSRITRLGDRPLDLQHGSLSYLVSLRRRLMSRSTISGSTSAAWENDCITVSST